MGCVASKLEEEEEVVFICRERKQQLKLAVERRYKLAEAHCKYCHSLYAVAAAIKLFVARHSSPSSPFLITFPPPCPPPPPPTTTNNDGESVFNNPMFLQQMPSQSTHKETIACQECGGDDDNTDTSSSSTPSESSTAQEETKVEKLHHVEENLCEYFYMQVPQPQPCISSPQRDFGWDFFNPFDGMRQEVISGYRRSSDDDVRVVREEEGIPELEEEEEEEEKEGDNEVVREENGELKKEEQVAKMEDGVNESQGEQKCGLTVIDSPEGGRELLEALKDIEDHFIRAFDSGKDVSRMLEANRAQLQSGLEEIKENSTKLIQAITWHRSASSKPSSCKSLVASSSKGSSTWTEFKNDLFDDYGGMESGSHSLTLERLYAWEKKLYEEVKAGDATRKIYERKLSRLRNQDVRGDDDITMGKTRASVKDLYARILVAIRSAESISKKIEKLRDDELQLQIVELLKGLSRTWKIMSECHQTQHKILVEVKSFDCPTYGKFCNDSHRLATLQLEAELQNWRSCFMEYISAQRTYVEVLHGWLSKFVVPEVEFCSRGRSLQVPYQNGPPLLSLCHDWVTYFDKLPDLAVTVALKSFSKDVRAIWAQQGEEQQQKRRVDSLAKELDRKILVFQKTENMILDSKLTEEKPEFDVERRNDYLSNKKEQLDILQGKLDIEKSKHHTCMQETQRITLNGFQTGFSAVFDALDNFSKASFKMYNDLVNYTENSEKVGKVSFIEGSQAAEKMQYMK